MTTPGAAAAWHQSHCAVCGAPVVLLAAAESAGRILTLLVADSFKLLLGGEELPWPALQPTVSDSGNWGGSYPGSQAITDSAAQYCSAAGSFSANPADAGSSSLPGAAGGEVVTLEFATPAAFDGFQLQQVPR